jgi:hypothetical protein
MVLDVVGLGLFVTGLIIGLGAATVIDVHGFLGRHSGYWTEATIRTHKVTKPLIWLGLLLCVVGGAFLYRNESLDRVPLAHVILGLILLVNGLFLSFGVSPMLLHQEASGQSQQLLPTVWQRRIYVSFLVSLIGWWSTVLLFIIWIAKRIS